MWDNLTPLQLLKTMPKVLEKDHLEILQNILAADKYKNQIFIGGDDLCGQYAPFCTGCDKNSEYPCATAYVNFMKAQGMDIEIASSGEQLEIAVSELAENTEDKVSLPADEQIAADEENVADGEANAEAGEAKPEDNRAKFKIRIAVARKKNLL